MELFLIETPSFTSYEESESLKNKLSHVISWDFRIFNYFSCIKKKKNLLMYKEQFCRQLFQLRVFYNWTLIVLYQLIFLIGCLYKNLYFPETKQDVSEAFNSNKNFVLNIACRCSNFNISQISERSKELQLPPCCPRNWW